LPKEQHQLEEFNRKSGGVLRAADQLLVGHEAID
jgi:hypothetical protein